MSSDASPSTVLVEASGAPTDTASFGASSSGPEAQIVLHGPSPAASSSEPEAQIVLHGPSPAAPAEDRSEALVESSPQWGPIRSRRSSPAQSPCAALAQTPVSFTIGTPRCGEHSVVVFSGSPPLSEPCAAQGAMQRPAPKACALTSASQFTPGGSQVVSSPSLPAPAGPQVVLAPSPPAPVGSQIVLAPSSSLVSDEVLPVPAGAPLALAPAAGPDPTPAPIADAAGQSKRPGPELEDRSPARPRVEPPALQDDVMNLTDELAEDMEAEEAQESDEVLRAAFERTRRDRENRASQALVSRSTSSPAQPQPVVQSSQPQPASQELSLAVLQTTCADLQRRLAQERAMSDELQAEQESLHARIVGLQDALQSAHQQVRSVEEKGRQAVMVVTETLREKLQEAHGRQAQLQGEMAALQSSHER